MIVGCAACTGDSAMPQAFSSHIAGQKAQAEASCNKASPNSITLNGTFISSMPSFLGTHDPRSHL